MSKARSGNYFEDFRLGATLKHATPRTIHGGDLSLYIAATGDRRPVHSSTELAMSLGYRREVVHDLLVFHLIFGKSVEDISKNAIANLGYADVRFLEPVYPGDTVRAQSEIIGLRETSSGASGVVYVRTRGFNQKEQEVLCFVRWVLVEKRDRDQATGAQEVPELPAQVESSDLPLPAALNLTRFEDLRWVTGGEHYWDDYQVGETIAHGDGMTIEEADHLFLTRLYQNTARVHFDQHQMLSSRFGRRLVYGGHVISVAHALSFVGLENALGMVAWNSGIHANPTFAGDTLYAQTEILAKDPLDNHPQRKGRRLGALRLRLLAFKNANPRDEAIAVKGADGVYDSRVVLDLDYWTVMPRR